MSKKNPKLHLSILKRGDATGKLYEDKNLRIDVDYKWSGDTITEMQFELDGLGIVKYKIMDINPCTDEYGIDFYMVHIYQHTDPAIPDPSEFTANSKVHIPGLEFSNKLDIGIFRFNIFSKEIPITTPCEFNEIQPETKDGAIIVSI
jgi:hypothetical protein